MSKRHAASRRRSYGRRQHEVSERRDRDVAPEPLDAGTDELAYRAAADGHAMGDLLAGRTHFATGS